jgi:serine/threonine protein kinase
MMKADLIRIFSSKYRLRSEPPQQTVMPPTTSNFVQQIWAERYHIKEVLGGKAGRQTFLAEDLHTQLPVVVKVLWLSNDFPWDQLQLFKNEAEILKSLSYLAIPPYLDWFELEGLGTPGFALVQRYLPIPTLENQLESGKIFSEAAAKHLAFAVLDILHYLHDRPLPVIHQAVKPCNLLVGTGDEIAPLGEIYLVDFGTIQTLAARRISTMTAVGTYGYLPPEQFNGQTNPSSDLYSLGATLIYMVTGQHPGDLPHKDFKLEFAPFASHLTPEFMQWLKQLVDPIPSDRLTTVEAALSALGQP